jgi:hypothetical protein
MTIQDGTQQQTSENGDPKLIQSRAGIQTKVWDRMRASNLGLIVMLVFALGCIALFRGFEIEMSVWSILQLKAKPPKPPELVEKVASDPQERSSPQSRKAPQGEASSGPRGPKGSH